MQLNLKDAPQQPPAPVESFYLPGDIHQEPLEAPQKVEALPSPPEAVEVPRIDSPAVTRQAGNDSLSQWLQKLRMCESGGNYAINTGNSFYGAYQFTIPTWNHWNTGYSRADLAPPDVQDATIIKNTLASDGLVTQNPGCYRSQGLSNYPPTS